MTKIMIFNENPGSSEPTYRASSGDRQSVGRTPGAALDALAEQLDDEEGGTLVVVQNLRPDPFFTAAQQERLRELLDKQEAAKAAGVPLQPPDRAELQSLIDAELEGATRRAAATLDRRRTA